MSAEALPMPESAALEVRVGEQCWVVPSGGSVTIGRDDSSQVQITDLVVSRRHAVVESTSGGWVLVDQSRNGIFLHGRRIDRLAITAPMEIRLGEPNTGIRLTLTPSGVHDRRNRTPPTHGQQSGVHNIRSDCIRVGRLPDNDVVVDDLLVSRHHAELHRRTGGWRLVDLASPNGTYVNGQRISQAVVTEGDVIGIGHTVLELVGDRLVTYVDTGDVEFEVRDLVVTTVNGQRLLNEVGFTLNSRSLLAVVGPSGAGKSTLLGALTGSRPASSGTVRYGGRDLYANYDELRQRIGLVPQEDILHPQLTVRRALSYAAQLRFPFDTSAADREQRIDEVLAELQLNEQAGQRISSLSGGQRKRTSVALELLTRPSLLFLDEPTSGLDPGMDKSVMQTLRGLADGGRTVVVVTHSVANLDLCDRLLVLAPGGQLAYYGPPAQALDYFGQADYADLFQLLERERNANWTDRFRRSEMYRQASDSGRRRGRPRPATDVGMGPRQQPAFTQFAILCRRYLAVIGADRQYVVFLALLPLVLSLLARAVPGSEGLSASRGGAQPSELLLVLIMGGSLMGSAAAVRELVKERAIFARERAAGLSPTAYLGSKLAVLSAVCGVQAALFAVMSMAGLPGPDGGVVLSSGRAEIVLAVIAASLIAMVVGLVISALISNADRGMPLLVLLVMVQLILCGGLFPVQGRAVLEQLSWLVPTRWAYAMGASTIDLNIINRGQLPTASSDSLWDHTARVWGLDLCALAAIGVLLVLVTALSVHREALHRSSR